MRDIGEFITKKHEDNYLVLLLLDGNTDLKSSEMKSFCVDMGMKFVIPDGMNEESMPRTHQRGSQCIDYTIVSVELEEYINASGYLPFHSMGLSDHRPIFVDLDYELLFGKNRMDKTKLDGFFTTTKKKPLRNYLTTLKELCEKSKLLVKMEELKEKFEKADANITLLVEELNKYDVVREQLMKSAQKSAVLGMGLNNGPLPWRDVVLPYGTQENNSI